LQAVLQNPYFRTAAAMRDIPNFIEFSTAKISTVFPYSADRDLSFFQSVRNLTQSRRSADHMNGGWDNRGKTVLNFATLAFAAVSVIFGPVLVWVLIWMASLAG
jgi:hypothetical protein